MGIKQLGFLDFDDGFGGFLVRSLSLFRIILKGSDNINNGKCLEILGTSLAPLKPNHIINFQK